MRAPAAPALALALLHLAALGLPGAQATHTPWHVFYVAGDVCVDALPPHVELAIDGGCTLRLLNPPGAYIHVHGPLGEQSPFVPFSYQFLDDEGAPCGPVEQAIGTTSARGYPGCGTHLRVAPRLGVVLLDTGQPAPWGEIWVI